MTTASKSTLSILADTISATHGRLEITSHEDRLHIWTTANHDSEIEITAAETGAFDVAWWQDGDEHHARSLMAHELPEAVAAWMQGA